MIVGRPISEAPKDGSSIIIASIMRVSGVPETGHHSFVRLKWMTMLGFVVSYGWCTLDSTANFSMLYSEGSILAWWPDGTPEHLMETRPRTNFKWQPSNGTEGECFIEKWCEGCVFEHAHMVDETKPGCDILTRTMAFGIGDPQYPEEWTNRDGEPRCTKFQQYREEEIEVDADGEIVLPPERCKLTKDLFDV